MILKKLSIYFFLGLLIASNFSVFAQSTDYSTEIYRRHPFKDVIKLIGGAGVSYFVGDLPAKTRSGAYWLGFNVSVGMTRQIGNRVALRGEVRFYRLVGAKWDQGLWFQADNFDIYGSAQISLFKYTDKRFLNPYIFAGIGLTTNTPRTQLNGEWYKLQDYATEGSTYKNTTLFIPAGIGVQARMSRTIDVGIELCYNYSFMDYMDDVSKTYLYIDPIQEPVRAALADRRPEEGGSPNSPGGIRGNPNTNDAYFFMSVRLAHTLGSSKRAIRKSRTKCE